jgi:hypothetical protein
MANYPQELAQTAVFQSHTGRLTGLWFLPKPAQGLNTNQSIIYVCVEGGVFCTMCQAQSSERNRPITGVSQSRFGRTAEEKFSLLCRKLNHSRPAPILVTNFTVLS